MKLLARTNLYYIFFSIVTYFIVAGSFYLVVEYVIYKEVDERLIVERRDFEQFVKTQGYWEVSCYFVEDKISIKPYNGLEDFIPFFKDTILFNRYDSSLVPFREYNFISELGEDGFHVSIRKSLIESNKLLAFITMLMLILLSVGLSILFLFQKRISKTIWKPFFDTLSKAKAFDVNEGIGLKLDHDKIFEFNELNSSLTKMTDKIASDYRNLKEFTENASHEIQTPLALINSRVEGLIQAAEISEQHMSWIQDIHESTMRLSKLNQALLLLAKIDNGQYHEKTMVDIGKLVEKRVSEQHEIFSLKGIELLFGNTGNFKLGMHPVLADVLINNLLINAVKHNLPDKGLIRITITNTELIISNTGPESTVNPEDFFQRFKKQNKASSSLGLGLAIVKKICDISGLDIHYKVEGELHSIRVSNPT